VTRRVVSSRARPVTTDRGPAAEQSAAPAKGSRRGTRRSRAGEAVAAAPQIDVDGRADAARSVDGGPTGATSATPGSARREALEASSKAASRVGGESDRKVSSEVPSEVPSRVAGRVAGAAESRVTGKASSKANSKANGKATSRGRGIATSTSALGAVSAADALSAGGSAVDAVLAGLFAEAGADPAVLLGPVSILVFGAGAGIRAFDGRVRQPGLGGARPRGTRDGESAPDAASVAAPTSIQTVMLVHTMYGRVGLSTLVHGGVSNAKAAGAKERAALLGQIGRAGVAAMSRGSVVTALLAAGGPAAGGALTEADLLEARPRDLALSPAAEWPGATAYRVPWGSQVGSASDALRGVSEALVATDGWGMVALLSYERAPGLLVPELEVMLSLSGVPVRRGVPRTAPGTALPAAAPLAIVDRGPDLRIALAARVEPASRHRVLTPAALEPIGRATPVDTALRALARESGNALIALAVEAKGARAIDLAGA
jgi:gamma-glutamyltranspeptidase/glutathione hydrolase